METLEVFCAGNGLTVSIKKTKWLLGGWVPWDSSGEQLLFGSKVLKRVQEFKYLRLVFTPAALLSVMWEAWLVAPKNAWRVL